MSGAPFAGEHVGHLAALACASMWALSTVLFGAAARTVDPRALNLLKCALAAPLLGVTALLLGDLPAFSARDSAALAVSALFGIVVADTAYFVALKELGAARGVLFVALIPVCTSLLALPVLGEALEPRMVAGMIVTLSGVVVVVRGRARGAGRGRIGVGVVAGVVYCTAQAAANVLQKGVDPALSPLSLSFFRLSIGAAVIALSLVVTVRGRRDIAALRPVLARGSLGTLAGAYAGLLLGTYAIRTVPTGVATTLIATTPLFALVAARVVDKETPSARTLAGALLALAGVALLML